MSDADDQTAPPDSKILELTTEIVSSYLSKNQIPATEIAPTIRAVYVSLGQLVNGQSHEAEEKPQPAVPVKKSVTDDYIVCLEDGKKLKMLKRYLRTHYDMSPEEYRSKWGLPADYPMVAPNYARQRSEFAREIGLGRTPKPRQAPRKQRTPREKSSEDVD